MQTLQELKNPEQIECIRNQTINHPSEGCLYLRSNISLKRKWPYRQSPLSRSKRPASTEMYVRLRHLSESRHGSTRSCKQKRELHSVVIERFRASAVSRSQNGVCSICGRSMSPKRGCLGLKRLILLSTNRLRNRGLTD